VRSGKRSVLPTSKKRALSGAGMGSIFTCGGEVWLFERRCLAAAKPVLDWKPERYD